VANTDVNDKKGRLAAYQVESINNGPASDGLFETNDQRYLDCRPNKINEKFAEPNQQENLTMKTLHKQN
jgi:hypothetical protein